MCRCRHAVHVRSATSTGRWEISAAPGACDLAAHAERVRCALATASLDFDGCKGFVDCQVDADDADRAYGNFVTGQWRGVDARLLPARCRGVLEARDAQAQGAAAAAIEEPLAQLIASGTPFRMGCPTPDRLDAAIATASQQGCRRPLMALLSVQAARAEAAGDAGTIAAIRRRLDLSQHAALCRETAKLSGPRGADACAGQEEILSTQRTQPQAAGNQLRTFIGTAET